MSTLLPPPHPCADELRAHFAKQGIDVTVTTTLPPITLYEIHQYTCEHGVRLYPQPTDAQIARWREDGTQ